MNRLVKLRTGQIVGYPVSMRSVKITRRQNRLQRRAEFRAAKREANANQGIRV